MTVFRLEMKPTGGDVYFFYRCILTKTLIQTEPKIASLFSQMYKCSSLTHVWQCFQHHGSHIGTDKRISNLPKHAAYGSPTNQLSRNLMSCPISTLERQLALIYNQLKHGPYHLYSTLSSINKKSPWKRRATRTAPNTALSMANHWPGRPPYLQTKTFCSSSSSTGRV